MCLIEWGLKCPGSPPCSPCSSPSSNPCPRWSAPAGTWLSRTLPSASNSWSSAVPAPIGSSSRAQTESSGRGSRALGYIGPTFSSSSIPIQWSAGIAAAFASSGVGSRPTAVPATQRRPVAFPEVGVCTTATNVAPPEEPPKLTSTVVGIGLVQASSPQPGQERGPCPAAREYRGVGHARSGCSLSTTHQSRASLTPKAPDGFWRTTGRLTARPLAPAQRPASSTTAEGSLRRRGGARNGTAARRCLPGRDPARR